jgi:hypothetical protein
MLAYVIRVSGGYRAWAGDSPAMHIALCPQKAWATEAGKPYSLAQANPHRRLVDGGFKEAKKKLRLPQP